MRQCPKCGVLLSDQAEACPNCAPKSAPAAAAVAAARPAPENYPAAARALAWLLLLAMAFGELLLAITAMAAIGSIGAVGYFRGAVIELVTLVLIWGVYKGMRKLHAIAAPSAAAAGPGGGGTDSSPYLTILLNFVLFFVSIFWMASSLLGLLARNL